LSIGSYHNPEQGWKKLKHVLDFKQKVWLYQYITASSFLSFLSKMSSFCLAWVEQSLAAGASWGDVQYDIDYAAGLIPEYHSEPYEAPAPVEEPKSELIEPDWERDILSGWSCPNLSLRKGLWENFPVDVVPLNSSGSVDRYVIRWNDAKLADWRNSRAESWDEYQEFDAWCRFRLIDALAEYSNKYTVEQSLESRGDGSICVISMAHEAPRAPRPAGPRALDVLAKYPVSWDRDNKIHRIKLHRVKAAQLGAKENEVAFDLMGELANCVDCAVTRQAGYMMVVTLL